ncbi:TetR/AcrR family transcriptional regulator [Sphingobium sp. CR2-8]|uniref:TetR/AcrR family transcriptional regulator n=1 Tax=Sphingobium sp. CR2-8 TaxID=1306534 RepID=UPI002DBE3D5A|nr:TetR/AcrR family transcriptional regulator [Sphingobium sp. CR2-8]MEC3910992.1 TetR/AcrR family transcriptional regulator [Sphingobium sp. CR2-8]
MPATVDHEARRRHIADIAADLIAQGGMENATIRNVAATAGYSTAIVTHYFAHKRDLLLWAYRASAQATQRRFDAVQANDPDDLIAALCAFLPDTPDGIKAWRVYFAFWRATVSDPEMAAEQRWWQANALAIIGAVASRQPGMTTAQDRVARMLLAIVQGIATQAALDQDHWSAQEQHRALAIQVDAILRQPSPAIALSAPNAELL